MRHSTVLALLVARLAVAEEVLFADGHVAEQVAVTATEPDAIVSTPTADPPPPGNATFYDDVWAKVSPDIITECKTCPYSICSNRNYYGSLFMFRAACWTNGERINDTSEDQCYVSTKDTYKYYRDYTRDIRYCGEIPPQFPQSKTTITSSVECKRCPNAKCETMKIYPRQMEVGLMCKAQALQDCMGSCSAANWQPPDENPVTPWSKTSDNCFILNDGFAAAPQSPSAPVPQAVPRPGGLSALLGGWLGRGGNPSSRPRPTVVAVPATNLAAELEDCGPVPFLDSQYRAAPPQKCENITITSVKTVTATVTKMVPTTYILRPPPCETCPPLIWAYSSATLMTSMTPRNGNSSAVPRTTSSIDWDSLFSEGLPAPKPTLPDKDTVNSASPASSPASLSAIPKVPIPKTTGTNNSSTSLGLPFVPAGMSSPLAATPVPLIPKPISTPPAVAPVPFVPKTVPSPIPAAPAAATPKLAPTPVAVTPLLAAPKSIPTPVAAAPVPVTVPSGSPGNATTRSTMSLVSPLSAGTSKPFNDPAKSASIGTKSTMLAPTTTTPSIIVPMTSTPDNGMPTTSTPTVIIPSTSTPLTLTPTTVPGITLTPTTVPPAVITITITLPPIIITTTLNLPPFIVTPAAKGAASPRPSSSTSTKLCSCEPFVCTANPGTDCGRQAEIACTRKCMVEQWKVKGDDGASAQGGDPNGALIPAKGRPPPAPVDSIV